jgi:hypothetical protein
VIPFDKWPNPNDVGESEYRAIYEVCESAEDDKALIKSILMQFLYTARNLIEPSDEDRKLYFDDWREEAGAGDTKLGFAEWLENNRERFEEDVYECDNCGYQAHRDNMIDAKDLDSRLDPGGPVTDKECPLCGALAYPVEAAEEEVTHGV